MPDVPLYRPIKCPYGIPGDRLYVRETFQPILSEEADLADPSSYDYETGRGYAINYVADGKILELIDADDRISQRCTPSIHMPKWASRLWLEITAVRAERVQDITLEDVVAEGIMDSVPCVYRDSVSKCDHHETMAKFIALWDSLNDKRGYGWDVNPGVWVVEFKKVED
jgi:hypothetical protein